MLCKNLGVQLVLTGGILGLLLGRLGVKQRVPPTHGGYLPSSFLADNLVNVDSKFPAERDGGLEVAFQVFGSGKGFAFHAEELSHVVPGKGRLLDQFPDGQGHVTRHLHREP